MGTRLLKWVAMALVVSVATGCASMATDHDAPSGRSLSVSKHVPTVRAEARKQGTQAADEQGADAPDAVAAPTIIRGNDKMFNSPRAKPAASPRGADVTLRFEQAPVTDVVHAVLGDILGLPYAINQPVAGSLTIHTAAPLPRSQVLPVLEALLQANGLTMVVDVAGVYHVGRPETLRGLAPSLGSLGGAVLPPGQNILIVPLQYVGAAEMADILRPLTGAESFVRIDGFRNLLILAGTRSRLEGLLEVVRTFDVDVLQGYSVGLFPLQHASVKEVEVALNAMMGGQGRAQAAAPRAGSTAAAGSAAAAGATSTLEIPAPLAGVLRVVAIERLNALLVVTPRAYYLDRAREWIEKFDQPRDAGVEPQLFVYPVQNGTASHLSKLLTALFGGSGGSTGVARDSGVAPQLASASLGASSSGGSATSAAAAPATLSQVNLGPGIRVVADESNNALLVYAPRSEYRKIEAALRRLDIAPTQVLIEASILEVTLTDEFQFGLQWYFHGGVGGNKEGVGLFNPNPSGDIRPAQPGFSYTISDQVGQVRAVLNAMAQKSQLKVISSPSVMVLDNHSAMIQVGNQQPVRSATTVTDGGTTTSSIQFKDTGVVLDVKPSVNAGGLITMDIKQAVTDVGEVDAATGQRSFLQREIKSRVAVRSGETIVLGGLIRDNATRGRQGVPLLQDIPLLGNLFSTNSTNNSRTELVVLITPRALQNDDQLRAASNEIRMRLSSTLSEVPGWSLEGPVGQGRNDGAPWRPGFEEKAAGGSDALPPR